MGKNRNQKMRQALMEDVIIFKFLRFIFTKGWHVELYILKLAIFLLCPYLTKDHQIRLMIPRKISKKQKTKQKHMQIAALKVMSPASHSLRAKLLAPDH